MPIANSGKRPESVACSTCSGSAMKPNGVQPFAVTNARTATPAPPIASVTPASTESSAAQSRRVIPASGRARLRASTAIAQ